MFKAYYNTCSFEVCMDFKIILYTTLAVTAIVESRTSLGWLSVVISSIFSFCPLVLASSSICDNPWDFKNSCPSYIAMVNSTNQKLIVFTNLYILINVHYTNLLTLNYTWAVTAMVESLFRFGTSSAIF